MGAGGHIVDARAPLTNDGDVSRVAEMLAVKRALLPLVVACKVEFCIISCLNYT